MTDENSGESRHDRLVRKQLEKWSPVKASRVSGGKGLFAIIMNFIGAVFGYLCLASIGLGIISAVLSPSSCSSGGVDQEYRAL